MNRKIWSKIKLLAQYPQTSISLQNLYHLHRYRNQNSMIDAGQFMKKEMAIRLSKRTVELQNLKFGLANNPHIRHTRDLYGRSAERIMSHPEIQDLKSAVSLENMIKKIKEDHREVVSTMSTGVISVNDSLQPPEKHELDAFLTGFYGSRIGIRVLMGQYISVIEDQPSIIRKIKPFEIFNEINDDVQSIAYDCYGISPKIKFHGDQNYQITYIPNFLRYIFQEILKNAVRSTIETHLPKLNQQIDELPPIHVYQSQGLDDLIIKVSDQGGGFPRCDLNKVFSYSYTTVQKEKKQWPIIAGLGYGVPLSKLYATYFGGDLQLIPYHGIGTDAIIYIHRLLTSEEKEY